MNILDWFIVAAAVYILVQVLLTFTEKKETFDNLKAFNADTVDYNPMITTTKIEYNRNYIATNYIKLLYEFCMAIERNHHAGKLTDTIEQLPEDEFTQASYEKRKHLIMPIISTLNSMFNQEAGKQVIAMDTAYGVKEAFYTNQNTYLCLLFKIDLTTQFNELKSDQVFGVSQENKLAHHNTIIAFFNSQKKLHQLRLYGIESIDAEKVIGKDEQSTQLLFFNKENDNSNLTLSDQQRDEELQQYLDIRRNEKRGKCFIKDGIEDNIGFDVQCQLNGGIWDSPCKENNDCPYYDQEQNRGTCNVDTGYCELPKGMTQLSYRQAGNIHHAETQDSKYIYP